MDEENRGKVLVNDLSKTSDYMSKEELYVIMKSMSVWLDSSIVLDNKK
jgi:hypothetical protein